MRGSDIQRYLLHALVVVVTTSVYQSDFAQSQTCESVYLYVYSAFYLACMVQNTIIASTNGFDSRVACMGLVKRG